MCNLFFFWSPWLSLCIEDLKEGNTGATAVATDTANHASLMVEVEAHNNMPLYLMSVLYSGYCAH